MQSPDAPEMDTDSPPGLKALFAQLGADAKAFARAEADWLKAEAGERADIAKPALAAIIVALALVFGVTMSVPVGIMLILTPFVGAGLALLASVCLFLALSGLLLLYGSRRLKIAFKPRSDA